MLFTKSLYMFLVNHKTSTGRGKHIDSQRNNIARRNPGHGEDFTYNCNQDLYVTHRSPTTQTRTVARIQKTPLGEKPPFARTQTSALPGYRGKIHSRSIVMLLKRNGK